MLKVRGLKKSFSNTEVLKGVDLDIEKGEVLVVVGPSGGGKTTLLRAINALEIPEEGTVEINGKFLVKEGVYCNKKELMEIRRDIGLVFQNFNLFPHMTVLENIIEAPIRVGGIPKDTAIKNGSEILGYLGLEEKINSYPCELSGGQKQRVAIGRALALEPKVICFDEPTSALDPGLTEEVATLIKRLCKEKNIATLIITHDMEFGKRVSDRILSMDEGVLVKGMIFDEKVAL